MSINIAIDGPAGAGKSTIAKKMAAKLGFIYVDTGAMYRALAYDFLRNHIRAEEETAINAQCQKAHVLIRYEKNVQQVLLNGENITDKIRNEEVGNMASVTSGYSKVREKLLELQLNLANKENVIMDGRDIGTCVLPNAQVKIFLTASVDTRANRRYMELVNKGIECDLSEIKKDISNRDERDMTREIAPLKQAEDAILVDTSNLDIEETVNELLRIYKDKVEK